MARRLNMSIFFMLMVTAALLLQSSKAQTTHVVGGAVGWLVPPGASSAYYTTWASSETFSVGDVLVFNFTTGQHDVAEVTRAAFDACNFAGPISLSTNGPTSITLNSTGEHYFLCTFGRHCDLGQKLAINVSASSPPPSPAPQPSTPPPAATTPPPVSVPAPAPSPVSTPAPTPSPVSTQAPTPSPASSPAPTPSSQTFFVGDSLGWIVPPAGETAYRTWAANKRFMVGDILGKDSFFI